MIIKEVTNKCGKKMNILLIVTQYMLLKYCINLDTQKKYNSKGNNTELLHINYEHVN